MPHSFHSWMRRDGAVADATLTVKASAISYLGGEAYYPESTRFVRGITDWESEIVVTDFIGIPRAVDPPNEGDISETDHFEWSNGSGDIHFSNISLQAGFLDIFSGGYSFVPYWGIYLPGDQDEIDLPPLTTDADDAQIIAMMLMHYRTRPGFVYDQWSYDDLGREAHEAYAINAFYFFRDGGGFF